MQRTRGRIATLALACVLLLSLGASYALAAQQQPTTGGGTSASKGAKTDKKQRHKDKGVITAARGDKVAIKKADGENQTFTLGSKTKFRVNGDKEAAAGDLKPGMKTTVVTREASDGSEKVKKVRAHTPKAGKKAAKSEKASSSGR